MIAADKKLFEANFAAENFMIHKKMLMYYQGGIEGTTIASLATIHMMFSDIMRNDEAHDDNQYKMLLVYSFCIMGIICALMNSVLSSTVKIYGNAALLCEADETEVLQIIRQVRRKQEECAKWWIVCLLMLVLQGAHWAWDSGNLPVIISESVANAVAIFLMYYYGNKARQLFSPDNNDSGPLVFQTSLFAQYGGDMTNDDRQAKVKMLANSNVFNNNDQLSVKHAGRNMSNEDIDRELSKLRSECRRDLKSVEWTGVLWFRNLQDAHGSSTEGVFEKAFASLDNGSLNFYKNEDEYLHFTSTLETNRSIKLLDYELESNAKKVAGLDKHSLSLNNSLRSAVFGTNELSFMDMMSADFDVNAATSSYKFCLVPKQTSELSVHEPIFLMTEDKKTNVECLRALRQAIRAYEDLQAVYGVNHGARLVTDPKAALAFLHDRQTSRKMEKAEKEHAQQVHEQVQQLRVQANARSMMISDGSEQTNQPSQMGHLDALTSALHSRGSDLTSMHAGPEQEMTHIDLAAASQQQGGMLQSIGRSLSLKPSSHRANKKLDKKAIALDRQLQIRSRLKAIEGRGTLWTKGVKPLKSPKSYFFEVYAVLENGKLFFYKDKSIFIELGDMLAEPISLKDYKISVDRSTINRFDTNREDFSISKYVRQAVNSTDEIRSRDRMSIDFDYLTAVNNFKFCLKPSSARAKQAGYYGIIFMAENKKSFEHWVSLIRSSIDCIAELNAMNKDENYKESIQFKLTVDAEELIQKNNNKIKHSVDLT